MQLNIFIETARYKFKFKFCSSNNDVASECKNSKREKKLKHSRNLSLKEIKSCYRDKLSVGLLALGYITLSISQEGRLFEFCSSLSGIFRLHFHNYFGFVSSFS